MTAESNANGNQSTAVLDRNQVGDDSITRWFAGATILWGLVATVVAALLSLSVLLPDLPAALGVDSPELSYGRLRPIFMAIAVYAFAGNAAFAAIYYTTQRLCKRRMWNDLLSGLHFVGWQLVVIMTIVTIPRGLTQGHPLAAAEWPIDAGFAVVWILFFGLNFAMTIAKRREKQLYISLWFYIATVVSIAVYQIVHLLVVHVGSWESHSQLAGTPDALIQSVFAHNTINLLLTMPFLGLIYYFVPKVSARPIYSYKLAIAQFWGMIACFYWVGPAQLHLTAIPGFVSSLAMVFGLILWMPAWGGVINGLLTLRGGVDADDNEQTVDADRHSGRDLHRVLVLRFLAIGVVFLGVTTFFSALTAIKSVSGILNYTEWVNAQFDASVFGCCGMLALGMIYWLMPKLFGQNRLNESLVSLHFWLATIGVFLATIAGYAAGLWQGRSLMALSPDTGRLVEPEFLSTVEQVTAFWWVRLIGLMFLAVGMLVMAINYLAVALATAGKCDVVPLSSKILPEPNLIRPPSQFADAPMLDIAKSFDVWRRLDWHRVWERDASKFVFLPLLAIAIATLFQVVPSLLLTPTPIASVQPYTPLELAGRDIFVREGCVHCHTQMVRPLVAETKRYGDFSQAGEFVYDHPAQWGYRRVGPDLAREGGKQTSHWHWVHLRNPRDVDWGDPRSAMPAFEHLASNDLNFESLKERVALARELGAEYWIDDDDIPDSARLQAERIAADVVGGGGPIWTERSGKEPLMVFNSEAIALIAYLQRLGTDLFKPPPVADADATAVATNVGQESET
ncbi:MAG: cytochrome C oxidase Cbb3 [Pirellulaceae bacterium]|nr:cytochrome C oxidase Cbb3 [Pirellulaceae bacterium]